MEILHPARAALLPAGNFFTSWSDVCFKIKLFQKPPGYPIGQGNWRMSEAKKAGIQVKSISPYSHILWLLGVSWPFQDLGIHHILVQSLPAGPDLYPVPQPSCRHIPALSALLPLLPALSRSLLPDNPNAAQFSVFNFPLACSSLAYPLIAASLGKGQKVVNAVSFAPIPSRKHQSRPAAGVGWLWS